jgi:NAD(P)-dependent dehydrogenase (short-subunit alcohol dehydrogenase family)
MLISKGKFGQNALKGEVAVITGAGRGIGFEAARALCWLGATVVIAEVDEKKGRDAQDAIDREFGLGKALFVKTDVGNEADIDGLSAVVQEKFGKVDVVLNNATVFPLGAVKDASIESWDHSYRVNLRGPVFWQKSSYPKCYNASTACSSAYLPLVQRPIWVHTRSSKPRRWS